MIKKEIMIDGQPVPFRASAAVPRLYRGLFGRDIFRDFLKIEEAVKKSQKEKRDEPDGGPLASRLPIDNLEVFENIAYVMAKHADPAVPDTPEEWLEQFNTFSIYEVLPEISALWHENLATDIQAKKNRDQLSGR